MPPEPQPKRTKPKSASPEILSVKKPTASPPETLASEPAASAVSAAPVVSPQANPTTEQSKGSGRQHPIPPVSERLQYRAIGLVKGTYKPDPEQFNRGFLLTSDGEEIEAVLLGQVMNVIKKYLDPDKEHLWVVYPRTRDLNRENRKMVPKGAKPSLRPQAPVKDDIVLHLQIVGVWEPEILQQDVYAPDSQAGAAVEDDDGYFSIRGEVIFNSQEKKFVMVKIQQQAKRKTDKDKEKAFKVRLEGVVEMKSPGYFWDLHVKRQGAQLVITEANPIGVLPPRKLTKSIRPGKPPARRPLSNSGERPNTITTERRPPTTRPIRRTPSNPSS